MRNYQNMRTQNAYLSKYAYLLKYLKGMQKSGYIG